MSYSNPKRIVDKRMEKLIETGGTQGVKFLASTAMQMANTVKAQKAQLAKQQELTDNKMQSMYSMANEFGSTGDPALDQNIVSFWNGKVDNYFQIKNKMQSGEMSRQEGNMALAKIQGLVPKFQSQIAYIAEQSAAYGKALSDGTLSSTGSMQNKDMLGSFMEGGDIQIAERGGNIYFFKPNDAVKGETDFTLSEDMKTGNASMLNGDQLIAMKNQGTNLFNEKADISALTTTLANETGNPDGPSSYYETIKLKKGSPDPFNPGQTIENIPEGMEYEYQTLIPEQGEKLLADMENSPMVNTIMSDDKRMLSVFQDDIPDNAEASNGDGTSISEIAAKLIDENNMTEADFLASMGLSSMEELENSSWHEAPENLSPEQKLQLSNVQDQIARKFIARKAFDENVESDGIGKLIGKNKILDPPTDTDNKPVFSINDDATKVETGMELEAEIDMAMPRQQLDGPGLMKRREELEKQSTFIGISGEEYDWIDSNEKLKQALQELAFGGTGGLYSGKGKAGYTSYLIEKKKYDNFKNKSGGKTVDDYLKG